MKRYFILDYYISESIGGNIAVEKLGSIDGRLVINPSVAMSVYCYSVLRLDPFMRCSHGCVYCYTRYLPFYSSRVTVLVNYPRLFGKFLDRVRENGVKLPAFRLSALTDPFQPAEEKFKLSYRLLKICLEKRQHVIVSTKSDLLVREPWTDVIKELADEGLTVVQFTVTLLDDEKAKIIEPKAPPPSKRLKAAELLASEGVPVVFRLQPLIPYVNSSDEFLEEYVDVAKSTGVKQIICEVYRFLQWSELEVFKDLLSPEEFRELLLRSKWERLFKSSHKVPRREWRLNRYRFLRDLCVKKGILFSLCREELFELSTAPNCCGMHFMKNYVVRETIREVLGKGDPYAKILTLSDIEKIPFKAVREKLKQHYLLLRKYISERKSYPKES